VVIEFFKGHHWQEDVVLLESKKTGGVMHQHIGIEHKGFGDIGIGATP